MKSVLFKMIMPIAIMTAGAVPAWAENEVQVTRGPNGKIYTVDMDSLRVYRGSEGVTQVDFMLSTVGDEYWHEATASCSPYDVKSAYYKWTWSGTKSYPAGTVGGDIARAVCP